MFGMEVVGGWGYGDVSIMYECGKNKGRVEWTT